MKLYTSPGACSLSCHISLEETKLPAEIIVASRGDVARWSEIEKLNPAGAVPVLVTDDGKTLTQNIAIQTYLADLAPEKGLLPKFGSWERAQAYQWLSWVGCDLHGAFRPLFDPETDAATKRYCIEQIQGMFEVADKHLASRQFLVGDQFSAADAFFFVVYSWAPHMELPCAQYRNLITYAERIARRPAVQAAMRREGLI